MAAMATLFYRGVDALESLVSPSSSCFLKKESLLNIVCLSRFNPLSPNSDENEISLFIITTCSNIQVMRIKEVITQDKMSWYLDKFSLLVP